MEANLVSWIRVVGQNLVPALQMPRRGDKCMY